MTMREFVAFGALIFAVVPCAKVEAFEYTVKDLGKLDIAPSAGNALNGTGNVTGYSYVTGETYGHAFLYDGSMHDLGTFGGHDSFGTSINHLNQVTGGSNPTTPGVVRAFLYDGTMHDLGTLGGSSSVGYGINSGGQVVGYAEGANSRVARAFLWTPDVPNGNSGTMHDLGTLASSEGGYSMAYGINTSGQVTGGADANDGFFHAFVWTPSTTNGASGTMHDLGDFAGAGSSAKAINDRGQVVGYYHIEDPEGSQAIYHAFLWTPTTPNGSIGTWKDLGTFSGTQSNAYAINNKGHVTGFAGLAGDLAAHAFLYTETTGMLDLNDLIDPQSGWKLANATGINDAGQITGFGSIDGEDHAFLLTPVPEPSTFVLVLVGLACVRLRLHGLKRRRRQVGSVI